MRHSSREGMQAGGIGLSRPTWHHHLTRPYIPQYVYLPPASFHRTYPSYPKWCSLCNDFGTVLVLCCTCRVAICVKTKDTPYGCLRWDKAIDDDSFVFYCVFCSCANVGPCPVCVSHAFTLIRVLMGPDPAPPYRPIEQAGKAQCTLQVRPTHPHHRGNMAPEGGTFDLCGDSVQEPPTGILRP
jgi:hypothetical protein